MQEQEKPFKQIIHFLSLLSHSGYQRANSLCTTGFPVGRKMCNYTLNQNIIIWTGKLCIIALKKIFEWHNLELNLFFRDWIAVSLKLIWFGLNLYFFFSYPNIQLSVYWNIWLSQSFLATQSQFSETDFRSWKTTNCAQMHRSPIRVCKNSIMVCGHTMAWFSLGHPLVSEKGLRCSM